MATGNIVVSPNNSTSLYQGSAQPNVVVQVSNTNPTSAIIPQNNSSGLYNASGLVLTPQQDIIGNNIYASGNIEALGYLSVIGNVYGDYIYGNGAFLSYVNGANIVGGYGNAQVAAYLQVYNGNITAYNISTFGNITTSANMIGNNSFANTLTVNTTGTFGNINFPNGASIDQLTNGLQISANVANGPACSGLQLVNSSNSTLYANANVVLRSNACGTAQNLTFDTAGNLSIPGSTSVTGNLTANNITALTGITIGNSSLSNGNLTVGNISVSGNITGNGMLLTGDANILGNLNVEGNITFNDIDVIVTNDLYIQLANNRTTYANINNAGLVVGPVGSPLTNWQYNFAANSWTTNVSISATANVRGNNMSAANNISAGANVTASLLLNTGPYIRLGNLAGATSQSVNAIAIGNQAGSNTQSTGAIAIGRFAGYNSQGINSVAVGVGAGEIAQGDYSVAIGYDAGNNNQGGNAIAIGYLAGNISQGDESIAIGFFAGNNTQGANAVALGRNSGNSFQGDGAIAIGQGAGNISQGGNSIAIGRFAGNNLQGANAVALGRFAGSSNQGSNAIAIGRSVGNVSQGIEAIAIGHFAGNNAQGNGAIAIGFGAGYDSQAANSIVITAGGNLTSLNQGFYVDPIRQDVANVVNGVYYDTVTKELTYAVAGGQETDWANIGNITNQYGPTKIAVGKNIGTATGNESIAIGNSVWGGIGQSTIAIGANAATDNSSDYIIAIGDGAGRSGFGQPIGGNSIAIGRNAGNQVTQGNNSVAIGFYSSARYSNSIAIGTYATAGYANVGYNTIVLNASGNALVGNVANSSLYIDPIRNSIATNSVSQVVCYNTTTKEVTYSNRLDIADLLVDSLSSTGTISAGGNITGGNLRTAGLITATGNITGGNLRTAGAITATGNIIGGTILATNNISAGGNVIGDYFLGNIFAASIIGNVNYANTAGTVLTNAQPNITSVGTLTSLSVTGNIATGNLSAVSNITAVNFISTGFDTQANVGNVYTGNLILSTFSSNTGPKTGNLESGNIINEFTTETYDLRVDNTTVLYNKVTITALTGTANLLVTGAISATGNITGNYFIGNGSQLTGVVANISYSNSNVASYLQVLTSNISTTGNVTANYFIGNGSQLTSLTGANVTGTVANATYAVSAGTATTAGTVTTNAQPNITSVGTLTSLTSTGLISTTGNISGNYFIGNGSQLTGIVSSYSNTNVASYLQVLTSNISTTGNITANYFTGNGSQLTSLTGANVTGTVANATYATTAGSAGSANTAITAGTVTTNAQPNITSVGTLTTLSVTGNVSAGNVLFDGGRVSGTGNIYAGNVITANTIINNGISTSGNILFDGGRISGVGNINGGNIIATYLWGNGSNITGVIADTATSLAIEVKNTSGGSLAKGTPVYATGTVGATDVIEVSAARADTLATMPAVGLLTATLANNDFGFAMSVGTLTAVNTSLYAVGQDLYVAATGGITGTRPTGTNVVQPIGAVARVSATTGSIDTNIWNYLQLPNLGSGNIWQGNAAGYPTEVTAYGNSNVESYLQVLTSNVSTTGNVFASYFIGDGSELTNLPIQPGTYSNSNVESYLQVLTSNVSTTGNITASYLYGDGSNITGLPASYSNANVATFLADFGSNSISTSGNVTTKTGTFTNGDGANFDAGNTQITLFFQSGTEYPQWIVSRHAMSAPNNAIDFFTSNNGASSVYPTDAVLGLSVNNGNVGIANMPYPGNALDVGGNVYAVGNISAGGNIVAAYLYGDGSNITGLPASYSNSNVESYLQVLTSNVSTTGNITASYLWGDGSNITGIVGDYSNSNVESYLQVLTSNVSTTGNITASYLWGDGSNITGLPASYGNANVANYLPTYSGVLTAVGNIASTGFISATGNVIGGNILTIGTMSATGNVTGDYFIGNGSQLTGIVAVSSYGNANVAAFLPTYTGNLGNTGNSVSVQLVNYKDVVFTGGNATGTITPDAASGSIYKYTLTGNITLNGFGGTPQAGQHIIIVLTQDATGNRLLTSTMKWAGGFKTLSTAANAVDIATVWYDGSTYYGALTRGYA